MTRLGYICDGCGYENTRHGPAACVQDDELNWYDLCSECYDEWGQDKEAVIA